MRLGRVVAIGVALVCLTAASARAQDSTAAAPASGRQAMPVAAPEVAAVARSPLRTVRQISPYADVRARAVGDIVTVAIIERASASNTSRLSTERNTSFQNQSSGGTGALSFIPDFGMSADIGRNHEGRGASTQEGRLTARMAVTVVEVKPNGDLAIAGEREVAVNDERETFLLTGTIRPADIGVGNVVYSSDIANAKITYKGKGQVSKGSHPRILARLLSWLF